MVGGFGCSLGCSFGRYSLSLGTVGWRWVLLDVVGCCWMSLGAVGCRWVHMPTHHREMYPLRLHRANTGGVECVPGTQSMETGISGAWAAGGECMVCIRWRVKRVVLNLLEDEKQAAGNPPKRQRR